MFVEEIPLLIALLTDNKAGVIDNALAVLARRVGGDWKSSISVPILFHIFSKRAGNFDHSSVETVQSLAADGSFETRRKADALLRLLNRCCFQCQNQIG